MHGGPLGYLFWHRPADAVSPAEYEGYAAEWQEALAHTPPEGLLAGRTLRSSSPPWLEGWPVTAYVDVYVLADFTALGELNARAVTGRLQRPHDAVARRAGAGSGALYAHRAGGGVDGGPDWTGATLTWHDKDPEASFAGTLGSLAGAGRAVWVRQLVLGAGSELLVVSAPGAVPPPGAAWSTSATALSSTD